VNDQNDLGILDVTPKGAGFIRRRGNGYLPGSGDIHVGRRLIQQHGLRTGDLLAGEIAKAKGRGKSRSLTKVASVNGTAVPASASSGRSIPTSSWSSTVGSPGSAAPTTPTASSTSSARSGWDSAR
jgi:hypothetical protein